MSIRSILRNKKMNPVKKISPYTKGTTLNKLANSISERIRGRRITFAKAYSEVMTPDVIKNHNQGEFRRYPPKGKPGCLEELLKLAVGKKLGVEI